MYAVPSSKIDSIPETRRILECIDGVFGTLSEKYPELEKHHPEFKAVASELNSKLDECEKIESADAKAK